METQQAALPHPDSASTEGIKAAWARRDFPTAFEILTQLCQQQPRNWRMFLNLGEAYGLRFNYRQAERYLDQAVSLASNEAAALAEAGRRCQRFKQPGMANRYFNRAAEHADVSPAVLVALAEFEEGHSRIEEALRFLRRALELAPSNPAALLARSRLHRLSGELEEGERLLRALLAQPLGSLTANAWYELGSNLDRQGRYDNAMAAFLQAKAIVRQVSAPYFSDLEKTHAGFRELETSLSSEVFWRWFHAGEKLRPERRFAFLCGHPRSGTTLLEQVLDSHPGIVATDETPFLYEEAYANLARDFPDGASMIGILQSASVRTLEQSRNEYFRITEAFVGQQIGDRLLVDKNPAMDVRIPIVLRIFPETSFLTAIRDPRDVCLSCFMLPLTSGEMGALYVGLEETATFYASIMGFSRVVRALLPTPQMEVRYEDLVVDLEGVSRRVLGFLGVTWDPEVLRFHDHAKTKPLRCGVDEAVAKPVFRSSLGRWRHYQKYLEPCLKKLDPFLRAFGYE